MIAAAPESDRASESNMQTSRYPAIYAGWIALCAILFFALGGAKDPSRPNGRILSDDAARMAEQILQKSDRVYRGYDAHVAYASRGEGQPEARWIVLLDAEPHSAMKKAVVVELRAGDGALLRIRRPG
jgi:hypothetical protein